MFKTFLSFGNIFSNHAFLFLSHHFYRVIFQLYNILNLNFFQKLILLLIILTIDDIKISRLFLIVPSLNKIFLKITSFAFMIIHFKCRKQSAVEENFEIMKKILREYYFNPFSIILKVLDKRSDSENINLCILNHICISLREIMNYSYKLYKFIKYQ